MKHIFEVLIVSIGLVCSTYGQAAVPKTAEEFFAEGIRLLGSKSFEQSLTSFEKSAALNARQPATFMNIGSVSLILKRYEKAEAAIRTAIKLDPINGAYRAELCAALSLQRKNPEALAECEEAVRLDPDSERIQITRLNAMQSARKSPEAVQALAEQLAARFRNSEVALVTAADASLSNRQYSFAASMLESLTSLNPNVAMYHGLLAEAYLRLARDTESLASARKALKLDPDSPYGNYAMGLIFFELGQNEEAATSLSKVTSDDPHFRFAKFYLAGSESRRGRHNEAVRILSELVPEDVSEVEFSFRLGEELLKLQRYREAVQAFSKANQLKPNDASILTGLGMSYMGLADFEKAVLNFDLAFRLKPENDSIKMFLGAARGRQNAIANIDRMIADVEANPKDVKKRADLVFVLATSNRIDEAESHVAEIYRMDPADPLIYHRISVAYSEGGRKDKALDAARRSLAKRETPDAHLALAALLADRGEAEAASAEFARVLELRPDAPNIMRMYGDHLRNNGKRREALEIYKKSLALSPNIAVVVFEAGMLSMKLGDRDAALSYLSALKNLDRELARSLERSLALRIWG